VRVNRASNSFKSGGSTTTSVAAGRSALAVANAITSAAVNGVGPASRIRNASSTAASLVRAACCRIFK
jgi:hypothetical protein